METTGQRIYRLRKQSKKTQGALGKIAGVSDVTVGYWEKDLNKPSRDPLKALSVFFNVSENYILYGDDTVVETLPDYSIKKIPLISWVQAGTWSDVGQAATLDDVQEWVTVDDNISKSAFALRIKGDSMERKNGGKSIPDGSVIIVEPEFDPVLMNGRVAVAVLEGSNEATVKEFRVDGPNRYLVPWNDRYEIIKVNGNCRLVGYVKKVIIDL
jgi:SOS-response transcriptional repressor LexA